MIMARYTDPKCRLCRRQGVKLFLKGQRCLSPKCPIERKGAVPPGELSKRRRRSKPSEYSIQLKEKQKVKRTYGILERQFKRYFEKARKDKEATGEALLQMLESRLDNIVYRLGFASSRVQARQLVSHGHILVNGRPVNIASFGLKPDDTIAFSPNGMKVPFVKEALARKDVVIPEWLKRKAAVGKLERLPLRNEIEGDVDEKLVVEFYSR